MQQLGEEGRAATGITREVAEEAFARFARAQIFYRQTMIDGHVEISDEEARVISLQIVEIEHRAGYAEALRIQTELEKGTQIGEILRSLGLDEIITYSFISPSYYDKIRMPKDSPLRDSLKILNPLGEDTSIMRTSILPSMLEILTRNYNFRNKAAFLYEIGRIYLKRPDGLADEPKMVSIGMYGPEVDFFRMKGIVETLLSLVTGAHLRFVAERENPSYHPGRCAKVYVGDTCVGAPM